MNDEIRKKGKSYADFLAKLSEEERAEGNEINLQKTKAEYERFQQQYSAGYCYVCRHPLTAFVEKSPCPHWLLMPDGFRKKHLPQIAQRYGFYQIQSYLRWLANQDAFARNINDLPEEGTGKLFEVTIKYKNFEWGFSCAESDYQGHKQSRDAKHAHYHFQMRVNQRSFIKYNDFHLPLSEMDIINIEAQRKLPDLVKQRFTFGEGMRDLLNEGTLEHILSEGTSASDEHSYEQAPFKIDTFAVADEGQSISGDDIYAIIQEAKEKGVTIASLMHKLPNARATTIISPGPGVVEQANRKGRKGKGNDE